MFHGAVNYLKAGPADVRPLVLQLANESFTARPLTRASTGCVLHSGPSL